MPRTAPVPNIPAIPGMNPGMLVMGGGGAGGGAGAGGGNGKGGKKGAKEGDGKKDAADGKKDAGECGTGAPGGCTGCSASATRGDPVDLGTGEVFTTEARDLALPGFIELQFIRQYFSSFASQDVGLGFGWRHPFAWTFRVERRKIVVTKGMGVTATFETPTEQESSTYGDWTLAAGHGRYFLHTKDSFVHVFAPLPGHEDRWVLTHVSHRTLPGFRLEYDRLGRLTTIVDTAGRHVNLDLDASGRVRELSVSNPNTGQHTTFSRYEYDQLGNLTRHISADGFVTHYTYDAAHRLTSQSYPDGPTYHFVYDALGRCTESWGAYPGGNDPALDPAAPQRLADGRTTAKGIHHIRIDYLDDGYVEYTDSVRFQRFQFNASGAAELATSGSGVTTRIFDHNGNTITKVNANGAETRYEYDEVGRLSTETNALGEVAEVERDVFGRVVRQVDATGGVADAGYDRFGNLEWLRDQRGSLTQYAYDERGLLVRQVDGVGGVTEYEADSQGNLRQVTLPNGGSWRFEYDYLGRMVRRTDPAGRQVLYDYSTGGSILRIQQEDGIIQYRRNGFGRTTEVYAPEGVYQIRYGGYGWPYERVEPNGDVYRAHYNREGWLTKRYDYAGDLTEYKYDIQGLVSEVCYFDGTLEREFHDPMGNLIKRVAGSQYEMEYTRDALNRIVQAQGDDGCSYSFSYDALGNVVQSQTPDGRFDFSYDGTGNLTRDCQYLEGEEFWVRAEYDLMGRLIRLASSLGHREEIARNRAGARESLVVNGYTHVRYAYDSVGLEVAKLLPGGAQIVSEFDGRYRLNARGVIAPKAGTGEQPTWMLRRSYIYDASSLLLETSDAQSTTTFAYDARKRLTSHRSSVGVSEVFTYDRNDNLIQSAPNAPVRHYTKGNRIEAFGEYRFTHDDVGRVTEKRRLSEDGTTVELWTYHWNSQGFLAAAEVPGGRYISFAYDPFGRRIQKAVWSNKGGTLESKTRFVWFSDRMLHEITYVSGAQPTVRSYLHGDGLPQPWAHRVHSWDPRRPATEPVWQSAPPSMQDLQRPEDWVFYVGDIIQTPEVLVLGDGTVRGELRRQAFGRTAASSQSLETSPIRFVGQYADEETGLHYNHRRYYDPDLARYLSPDPIALAGGDNLYSYCAANPVSMVDAEGLAKHPATCELDITQGDKQGTWEPHSSGDGTPINPGPGQLSSGHTKDGDVHQVPGAALKGAKTGGETKGDTRNTTQETSHTEQHAIEWAQKNFSKADLKGSHMKLSGKLPPCNFCNKAMSQFSKDNESTVDYKWPQNNHVQYKGGEGPTVLEQDPVTGGPKSKSAKQKEAVDAMVEAYQKSNKKAIDNPDRKTPASGKNEYLAAKAFFE